MVKSAFKKIDNAIENVLKENLKVMKPLKFNRGVNITFEKTNDDYTKE